MEERPPRLCHGVRLLRDRYDTLSIGTLASICARYRAGIFHGINLPSFFGSTKKNSIKSPNGYAVLALFGFGAFTLITSLII